MGGAQAARVLSTVREASLPGGAWRSEEERAAFEAPILTEYERQGNPYYATARLWDDGVIDPAQTRDVLALAISAALNAPIGETRFGVFRM
jgi:3-methylcrotonyl-CoA carboxylase beta subunit